MTTDEDRDAGTELRLCARCGHPEDEHTLVEADGGTAAHTICAALRLALRLLPATTRRVALGARL